jgi:hypothetical protein
LIIVLIVCRKQSKKQPFMVRSYVSLGIRWYGWRGYTYLGFGILSNILLQMFRSLSELLCVHTR